MSSPKPLCILDIIKRMENGETKKADAEYVHKVLKSAGDKIAALDTAVQSLQAQIQLMSMSPAVRKRMLN